MDLLRLIEPFVIGIGIGWLASRLIDRARR